MAVLEPDYGSDISCTTDIDPMMAIVTGTVLMAQVCIRRLTCRKGSLLSDPLYGIDVRDFLGSRIDSSSLVKIQSLCIGELLQDERIFAVEVTASYTISTKTLALQIKGTGASGPFALVLNVSAGQVTAQILSTL